MDLPAAGMLGVRTDMTASIPRPFPEAKVGKSELVMSVGAVARPDRVADTVTLFCREPRGESP
jgi:hypothetical protein